MAEAAEAYDFVRFCWSDLHGIHRSKMTTKDCVSGYIKNGVGVYEGMVYFDIKEFYSVLINIQLTLILLITTIVVFNLFYWSTKSLLLGMKCLSKRQDLQIFVLKLKNYE